MFQALGSVFTSKGDDVIGFEQRDEKFVNVSGAKSGKACPRAATAAIGKASGIRAPTRRLSSERSTKKDSIINAELGLPI